MTRSRVSAAALAALVLAVCAAPAAAQNFAPSNKRLSFGLGGGVTVPVGDARSAFDNGVNGHGFVRLNLPLFPIQPRLDFSFQKMDLKDVEWALPTQGPGPYTGGEQQVLAGLAQAQFALIKAGPIQPYLLAGVGFANVETQLEGDGGEEESGSATKLAVNGGAGVNLKMGPVSGFLEGRIDNILNDGELVDFDSIQLVPISFGIVF